MADSASPDPRDQLLVSYAAGDTICAEGKPGSEMFIIEEGQVEISRRYGGEVRRITVLEVGDFFGEMSVLERLPRTATAKALTACRLLPIDASTFDQLLREHSEIAVRMMRKLSARLRQYEQDDQRAHRAAAGALGGLAKGGSVVQAVDVGQSADMPVPVAAIAATPAATATNARLVHQPTGTAFSLPPTGEISIGRLDPATGLAPQIDLGTLDPQRSMSRRHASITGRGGVYFLCEEIGTSNGTFVDGQRLRTGIEQQVSDGQVLRFGRLDLVFRQG